jgi:hypothetical protein
MAISELKSLWTGVPKTHNISSDSTRHDNSNGFWWQLSSYQSMFTVAILLATTYLCVTLRRLLFHPLSRFPGPWTAAMSQWYEFYYDVIQGGTLFRKYPELHKKYSKSIGLHGSQPIYAPIDEANKDSSIIRVGPNHLHVNDPDFYQE